MQVGEHPTLSKPATVDLGAVFAKTGLKLTSMSETMLTANQARCVRTPPRKLPRRARACVLSL